MLGQRPDKFLCITHLHRTRAGALTIKLQWQREGFGWWSYIGYHTGMSRIWLLRLWRRYPVWDVMRRAREAKLLVRQFCSNPQAALAMLHLSEWGALTPHLVEPAEEAVKSASDSGFKLTVYECGGQEQLRRGLGEAESQRHRKIGLFKDWSQISTAVHYLLLSLLLP